MAKRYSRKQIKKLTDKCCFFCKENDYNILDAHRIIPATEGGTYAERNMLVVCSSCHRKCHSGSILIDKKYFSTSGKWVLHYWKDGIEYWENL